MSSAPSLEALRARVARIERRATPHGADVLRFGVPAIDQHLPGGGLLAGALHEMAGHGADLEHGAAPALLLAGLLAQRRGPVLWAAARQDLFDPRPGRRRAAPGPHRVRRSRQSRAAGHGGSLAPSRPGRRRRRSGRIRPDPIPPPATGRGKFRRPRLRAAPVPPGFRPGARRAQRCGDALAGGAAALAAAPAPRAGRARPGAGALAA